MPLIIITYGKIVNHTNYEPIYRQIEYSLQNSQPLQYRMECYRDSNKGEFHIFSASVWADKQHLQEYTKSKDHQALKELIKENKIIDREIKKFAEQQVSDSDVEHLNNFLHQKLINKVSIFSQYYQENPICKSNISPITRLNNFSIYPSNEEDYIDMKSQIDVFDLDNFEHYHDTMAKMIGDINPLAD